MNRKKEIKKEYKTSLAPHKSEYKARKNEYKAHKSRLRAVLREALRAFSYSDDHPANPPKRTLLDEIGNAISHGIGAALSPLALVLMLLNSSNGKEIAAAVIYSAGMFLMFLSSCLYHSMPHGGPVKRLFHRFDYCAIYLMIGATFAPILLPFIGGALGWTFFAVQWGIIALGITLIAVFGPKRFKKVNVPMFLVLGWCGIMLVPYMWKLDFELVLWILGGGIAYSLGIIPFVSKKKAAHFIWHIFVLLGAVLHFFGIYLNIYLK